MAKALTRRFAWISFGIGATPIPFAWISFGIGATPIPVADLFLLAPLQLLLVAMIAGLSCRQANLETA
jgi:uncharacterized protein (DUF697 family)